MNRHERRKQQALSGKRLKLPSAPAPNAPTVVANYGNPSSLLVMGPLIRAAWSVPPARIAALQAAGRSVPPAVPGYFLIDTGATRTAMALAVASELGLDRIRFTRTLGAGGVTTHGVYFAHMAVSVPDSFGNVLLVEADREAAALPDLDKSLDSKLAHGADPSVPLRVIGLLGRDILQYCTLIYHGSSAVVELVLDVSAIPQASQAGPSRIGLP